MNGGQRPDFGGQRPDSLQTYIFGISIPNAQCMQNLGSIHPLGAILGLPSHIKVEVAVPLFKKILTDRILATNIWERHRLLKSTIGAMNMEQVSFDNVTSLFYCVVVVFPVLVVLEFLLYWLYQTKVIYLQCLNLN